MITKKKHLKKMFMGYPYEKKNKGASEIVGKDKVNLLKLSFLL